MPIKPGDKAPSFNLPDQSGKKVKLADFKGRKVLVYFYPKADTPGCTTQACGLRDAMPKVGDTAVIGISPDPSPRLQKFDTKYGLGFPLLADEDHDVARAHVAEAVGEEAWHEIGRRIVERRGPDVRLPTERCE